MLSLFDKEGSISIRNINKNNLREISEALLIFASLSYFLYYILRFSFYTVDDAYIHFRIARNIAEHGLPYYNLDERVLGSSPHAWINLTALLFKLFGTHLTLIPYFAWAWTCAAFLLLRSLLSEKYSTTSATALSFVFIAIFLLPSAAGLMETPMATSLFLLSLIFLRRRNIFWFGFFAGLCIWVRLEFLALIVIGLFFVGKQWMRYFASAAIPITLYLVYTYYYFDTPIPLPVLSKPIVFAVSFTEFFSWLPNAVSYPIPWRYAWPPTLRAWTSGPALFVLFAILFYQVIRTSIFSWITLALSFSALVLLTYFAKHTFIFTWYVPLFSLPLAIAISLISSRKTLLICITLFFIGLFNVFYIGVVNTLASINKEDYSFDEYASGWRVQQYLKIGQQLYDKNPNSTLLTSEIGALGWTFKGKIYDGAALISPEALQYHPMNVPHDRPWTAAGAIPYQVVNLWNPDLIVSIPIFSVAVRREIESGTLKYKKLYTEPIVPEKEAVNSGISSVWSSNKIEVFARDY